MLKCRADGRNNNGAGLKTCPRERVIRISKLKDDGTRTILKLTIKSIEKTAAHEELVKAAKDAFAEENPLDECGLLY